MTRMYHLDLMKKMKVQPARRNLLNSLIAIRLSDVVKNLKTI